MNFRKKMKGKEASKINVEKAWRAQNMHVGLFGQSWYPFWYPFRYQIRYQIRYRH